MARKRTDYPTSEERFADLGRINAAPTSPSGRHRAPAEETLRIFNESKLGTAIRAVMARGGADPIA